MACPVTCHRPVRRPTGRSVLYVAGTAGLDSRRTPLVADEPQRSLVIPMFDERARIGASIGVLAGSGLLDDNVELVLVDDGSSDDTPAVAERAIAEAGITHARVVRLPENRGKGAAVRAGMLAARGDVRVFVDADLCVDAKDIDRCFQELEIGPSDVVYGTRAHPSSELQRSQPLHRVVSGRTFNMLLRRLGLTTERDTQCGLKGFRATAAEAVFEPLVTERFAFDVEALARADRLGLRITPLPVRWSHVEASRVHPLRDGIDMAVGVLRIRRQLDREARAKRALDLAATSEPLQMDLDAVEAMARVEREHWWFRAKRDLVRAELKRRRAEGTVIDVGAGTGGLLQQLRADDRGAVGAELDPDALRLARESLPSAALVRSVAEALPFATSSAGAVTSLDVLEHLDDDVAGLRELARVAGPYGLVLVAVPAYQWAWSEHDVRLGHHRRYTRQQLVTAAEAAGIDVLRCTHFHAWLTPVAVLVRRTPVGRLLRGSAEEASFVHPTVNGMLRAVGRIERILARWIDLPFGLSILLVGRQRPTTSRDGSARSAE